MAFVAEFLVTFFGKMVVLVFFLEFIVHDIRKQEYRFDGLKKSSVKMFGIFLLEELAG